VKERSLSDDGALLRIRVTGGFLLTGDLALGGTLAGRSGLFHEFLLSAGLSGGGALLGGGIGTIDDIINITLLLGGEGSLGLALVTKSSHSGVGIVVSCQVSLVHHGQVVGGIIRYLGELFFFLAFLLLSFELLLSLLLLLFKSLNLGLLDCSLEVLTAFLDDVSDEDNVSED